jgi:Kdo2-lipid IVA lauroyltransferase/acyltransferase
MSQIKWTKLSSLWKWPLPGGFKIKHWLARGQLTPYCQPMDTRNQAEYFAFRVCFGLLRRLPYPAARKILVALGGFSGSVLRIRRSVVREQLGSCYPEKSATALETLTNLVYNHLGLTVAEVFCGDLDQMANAVRVTPGWQVVDQALAMGRGAIIATGHIGNFELGGAILARRYRLLDVVKTQRNIPFDRYLETARHRLGIETVPMPRSGPRVLRHLKSGGLVSLLLDQDAGDQGLTTSFLGRPASTWPGVARFSIRTGCPVIPMALIRGAEGGHELKISQPLVPDGIEDRPEEVHRYLEEISAAVEAFIHQHPEQWFWVHRRWKSRKGETKR